MLSQLGEAYVAPQEFRLSEIYADSAPSVPLIFVLSFGSDPMADLLKFAEEKQKQVRGEWMGQGEGHRHQREVGGKGLLIFVLSFGSDPMADLLKFAEEKQKQVRGVEGAGTGEGGREGRGGGGPELPV